MHYSGPLPNHPGFAPTIRFNARATHHLSQTHGSFKSHHRHSVANLQRVNLQHLYGVVVAPKYLRQWQRRSRCWRQALEYPCGSNHLRGLLKHQLQRRQSPLASQQQSYLAPLHHRGRFWWNLSALLRAEWAAARFLRLQLLQQLCWNWLELAKRQRRRQLHRNRPAASRRGCTSSRWHMRKRRLFRPQRRATVRLKQWALEARVPMDPEVLASEMDWVYRSKIQKRYRRLKMRRSRAFFAGPYRAHRRLLQLSGRRKLRSFGNPQHLSAARVRRLVTQLRRRQAQPANPQAGSLDPLLRGSRWDPNRTSYRGLHCRIMPTPFHHFGTAAFDAKRDFRWLAQEGRELNLRTKKKRKVWRVVREDRSLRHQMEQLRWTRLRRSRRYHFEHYYLLSQQAVRLGKKKLRLYEQRYLLRLGATLADLEHPERRPAGPLAPWRKTDVFRRILLRRKNQREALNRRRRQPPVVKPRVFFKSMFRRPQVSQPLFLREANYLNEFGLPMLKNCKPMHRNRSKAGWLDQFMPIIPLPWPPPEYQPRLLPQMIRKRMHRRLLRQRRPRRGRTVRQGRGRTVRQGRGRTVRQGRGRTVRQGRGRTVRQGRGRTVRKGRGRRCLRRPWRSAPRLCRYGRRQRKTLQQLLDALQRKNHLRACCEAALGRLGAPHNPLPALSLTWRRWGAWKGVGVDPLDPRYRTRQRWRTDFGLYGVKRLRWFGRWTPQERCLMRQTLRFRRRQVMPRPLDGLWDLDTLLKIKLRRQRKRRELRYWVDPARWWHHEAPPSTWADGSPFVPGWFPAEEPLLAASVEILSETPLSTAEVPDVSCLPFFLFPCNGCCLNGLIALCNVIVSRQRS